MLTKREKDRLDYLEAKAYFNMQDEPIKPMTKLEEEELSRLIEKANPPKDKPPLLKCQREPLKTKRELKTHYLYGSQNKPPLLSDEGVKIIIREHNSARLKPSKTELALIEAQRKADIKWYAQNKGVV